MSGSSLEIRLLGRLEVLRDGQVLRLPRSKKTRALLAYLVLTRHTHAREALCDLFWDGASDPRAELRWSLSKLRRVVGDHIVADRRSVRFDSAGTAIDLFEAQRIATDTNAVLPEAIEQCAARFRGELLEGLELDQCISFYAWCEGERERVRRLRATLLARLVDGLADDPEQALPHAYTWQAVDPYDERACAAIVRSLGALGRTQDALEQYERCRQFLTRELGRSHFQELESARRSVTRPASSPPHGDTPRPRRARRRPIEAPYGFVGRTAERGRAVRLLEEARDQTQLRIVGIFGEPGIGKTRLLAEALDRADSMAGCTLAGRAFETERARPYGPWIDALRGLEPDVIPTDLRTHLATLLPGLGPRGQALDDRGQLFDAVAHLLESLAREAPPLAFALDDVQWLDDSSAALLHYVVRTLTAVPMLLLLAARSPESEQGDTGSLFRALQREASLEVMTLGRLDRAATAALVQAIAADIDADQVFESSAGNPLYTIEIGRQLRDGAPIHASASLEERLRERLDRVSEPARALLKWAAVLGHGAAVDLLVTLAERSAGESIAALDELQRAGILRATGDDTFDFTHDLLRDAAYRAMSPPVLRLAHAGAARALDEVGGGARDAARIARHALLGGELHIGIEASVEAGEAALSMFAFDEVAAMAQQGLAHVDGLDPGDRMRLRLRLLRLYTHPGMADRRPADLEAEITAATERAQRERDFAAARTGLYLQSLLSYQRGDWSSAGELVLASEAALREADPVRAARSLGDTARCLALIERDLDRARAMAAEAHRLAGIAGVELSETLIALGLLHQYDGQLDPAIAMLERALSIVRDQKDPWWECPCLTRLAMLDLERKRPGPALERATEAATLAEATGETAEAAFSRTLIALASRMNSGSDTTTAAAFELALSELRAADSKWMVAWSLVFAAELDLADGEADLAHARATEALEVAESAARPGLVVHARALTARTAVARGDHRAAKPHLQVLRSETVLLETLPSRARAAVQRTLHEIPTH